MKVNTSNYRIVGFTREASLDELISLGKKKNIAVYHDLGSGVIYPLRGITDDEPSVSEILQKGADVLSFSADKMMGGPQAGIILGKKSYIKRLKEHPLTRALRVDKMTIAALEATLSLYRDAAQAYTHIPVLRMMIEPLSVIREKAEKLMSGLDFLSHPPMLISEYNKVGGGVLPCKELPTIAVGIKSVHGVNWLNGKLQKQEPPIIARIKRDRVLLDMRTVEEADFQHIITCLHEIEEGAI